MVRLLSNHSENTKRFLDHVRETLEQHKVKLNLTTGRRVRHKDGDLCAGFFCEPSAGKWGEIRVATGRKRPSTILAVLAHEYVHFLQWKQGDKVYTDARVEYIELEKHTEQKAIRLLKEWNVPLNYRAVKQRSQAYLTYLIKNSITG